MHSVVLYATMALLLLYIAIVGLNGLEARDIHEFQYL